MPLQGNGPVVDPCEQRIDPALTGELDLQQSHPGALGLLHPGAQRGGEQLRSQADAEHRTPGAGRVGDQLALGRQPGMVGIVAGAHRAPHRQHRVELAPVGQRLAPVELDRGRLHPPLAHHLREDPRVLTGDVLEDEDAHGRDRLPQCSFWPVPDPSPCPSFFSPCCSTLATWPVVASMRTTASCLNTPVSSPAGIDNDTIQYGWRLRPCRSKRIWVFWETKSICSLASATAASWVTLIW